LVARLDMLELLGEAQLHERDRRNMARYHGL
jgi:hypothetical protein